MLLFVESGYFDPELHVARILKRKSKAKFQKIVKKHTHVYCDVYFISVNFHDEISFYVVYTKEQNHEFFIVNSKCVRKSCFFLRV